MHLFLIILSTFISTSAIASELLWNCENLSLKWNEIPGKPGKEFRIDGCWQDKTYFLISSDCRKNPKMCLEKGKNHSIPHPGASLGSPAFSLCYRL